MHQLLLEARLTLRGLIRQPGFALTVILTLAVGIGANLAFFGYASYFLAPTIEAPEPGRVVKVHTGTREEPDGASSYLDWQDFRSGGARTFAQLPAYQIFGSTLAAKEQTLHAWGTAVSGEYFPLFGRPAVLGRLLDANDDRAGAERVLVLNHFFWKNHFGSDPALVGQTVELEGQKRYRIVGVAAEGFQGDGLATGIYIPLATAEGLLRGLDDRSSRRLQVLGRLRPGVSLESARAALSALARGLDEAHAEAEPRLMSLAPVTEMDASLLADPTVRAAKGLLIAVGLLQLLACANVANLVLARTVGKRREMAIHAALGAGRLRIARRLLAEALLLSISGGLLGLALARGITQVIEHYLLQAVPVGLGDFSAGSSLIADPRRMTLFFAALCLGTALLVSLAPLVQALRRNLVGALKSRGEGDRASRNLDFRSLLVIAQVALSVVLLLAAGLLLRTQREVRGQDLGFDPDRLTLVTLHIPTLRSTDNTQGLKLYQSILDRVRALPGVSAAGLAWRVPLSITGTTDPVSLPGEEVKVPIAMNVVSPEYLETLGLRLVAGRNFSSGDTSDGTGAALLNQAAVEQLFPKGQPLGQRLAVEADDVPGGQVAVVGVVANTRFGRLTEPIQPLVYYPFAQRFRQRMTLMVRANGPLAQPLAECLRRNFPDVAVIDFQPMSEQVRRAGADQKMNADLAGGFGLFGLGLAALGIFSVLSFTVSRSGRAIGIRMALGATGRDIGLWVLAGAGRWVAVGLGIGLAASWAFARLLESLLYGVRAKDPLIALGVVALLGTVALVAALVPASRAARIEPVRALKEE
ncbi:MAG TPA: ADOP family duplicated permease [Thermoanaerobaculia bacterium]|nr:ADOP family duplicated permease [Thermoanaerobaculia bacterium]